MCLLQEYEERHKLSRKLTLPQDDDRRLTRWCGGYRWFSDPNVICIEKARLIRNNQRQREGR